MTPILRPAFYIKKKVVSSGGGGGSTIGNTWSAQVVSNGGATPAAGTVSAANTFWDGLITDGIADKMYMVNMIAPDSIIAAKTPLYQVSGSTTMWTNVSGGSTTRNVAAGDLTSNGLVNVYGAWGLNTGITPSSIWGSGPTGGVSYYVYANSIYSSTVMGLNGGAANVNHAFWCAGGNTLLEYQWNSQDDGYVSVTATNQVNSFWSHNRTSNSVLRCDGANSSTGFVNYDTHNGSNNIKAPPTTGTMGFGCVLVAAGTSTENMRGTLSFGACHAGLTSTEANNLYNRVQTLRTSLGGGYR
jgi:hypothetical protein